MVAGAAACLEVWRGVPVALDERFPTRGKCGPREQSTLDGAQSMREAGLNATMLGSVWRQSDLASPRAHAASA